MHRILRYLMSGGTGVVVNLSVLFVLVDVVGLHYLVSSIISVAISTVVGFLLQKYWTFEARAKEGTSREFTLYVAVALFNILLNTVIVFVLVEKIGLHHLVAQFIGAGMVAVSSYVIYKKVIFKPSVTT